MNPGVVGAIITNMSELIKDDSSYEGGSVPGLQVRAREDSSSDDETNSCDDDGTYEDGEPWGYKVLTWKQIIGGTPGGMFPNNIPTLYASSWYGYDKICENSVIKIKIRIFIRPRNKCVFPSA